MSPSFQKLKPLVPVAVGIAFTAFFSFSVWLSYGLLPAAAVAVFGLLWIVVSDAVNILRLIRWMDSPETAGVPKARGGSWAQLFEMIDSDHKRLEKYSKRLSARETRFRKTLSIIPEGIVLVKTGWVVDWCNGAAESMLGFSLEECAGRPVYEVLGNSDLTDYLRHLRYEDPFILHSGERTFEITVVIVSRKNAVLAVHDISEREQLETVRRDFVANVSHELRTPLTVISGFLDMAADAPGDGPVEIDRRHAGLMRDQANRMKNIVHDLLTLSTLESAGDVEPEDVIDMVMKTQNSAEEARMLSKGRHTIEAAAETQIRLRGYPSEIRSAVGNLVANAVRYTPAGGRIRIRWYESGKGEPVFSVEDNGIGIAPEHISRITERFYRVDKSRSRDTGGTGLGLAIVKHVMMRHGGELSIRSELGKGSLFEMRFPASRAEAAAAPEKHPEPAPAPSQEGSEGVESGKF